MRKPIPTLVTASLLALLLALPAASPARESIAKVEDAQQALVFHPIVDAKRFTLTVSGPCSYHEEFVVEKGEIVFKLGAETFDGRYSYTLVATPLVDREVQKVLLKARETGDQREVRQLCRDGRLPDAEKQTQTGSFTVLEGRIVYDPKPELQRRDDRDGRE